jgi:hypothetical protein
MRRCHYFLVLALLAVPAEPAAAGIFDLLKKQPKPSPAERVPALLATARGSPDEAKRAAAVEELREYDGVTYPDIVPTLSDLLLRDKSPAVRGEAAKGLGKIRPSTQQAGWALEHALANDASTRVRAHARSALQVLQKNGYQRAKTEEPPLAPPLGESAAPATTAAGKNVSRLRAVPETSEAPPAPEKAKSSYWPLSFGRKLFSPSRPTPAPSPGASGLKEEDGPVLVAPK